MNLKTLILHDLNEEVALGGMNSGQYRSNTPNLEYITMPIVAPIGSPKRLAQEMVRCCPKLKGVEQVYGIEGVEIWETMLWLLEALPENQLWNIVERLEVQWSMRRDTRQQLCLELGDSVQVPWACTGLKDLTFTVAIPDQPLHQPPDGVVSYYNRASPTTLSEAETHQFGLLEVLYRQIGALTELHTLDLRAIFYDPQDHRPLTKTTAKSSSQAS
ncbi:hypothetical protein KI688_011833 [Linnemannia hyalina]|uniref:Uncharacterized protein n=1 Tax=Linnemannia hyalina TaxID=64524 RepID=A0A9P7XX47_9FUNG|nr:hypothetical protein KI688_011833 [Linnemannia hyalina]